MYIGDKVSDCYIDFMVYSIDNWDFICSDSMCYDFMVKIL